MASDPKITSIEVTGFTWDVQGMSIGPERKAHYTPGGVATRQGGAIKIHTDAGVTSEYAGWGGDPKRVLTEGSRFLGSNPFERERIYQDLKITGPVRGVIDIALWDLAGKLVGQPVHALLGTYRKRVPAYASTIDGATSGPLSDPESYADFAQQCYEMGYRGFKIHPFTWPDVQTHVDAVLAIGERVGGKMDLMLDSFNWYRTFADALKVGRACDEAGFYWYEDPYSDGGITPFSHAKLREFIQTPLLQGEKIHTIEERMAFVLADATDFIRAEVAAEGITATMKMAHAAETLGLDVEPHTAGPAMLHFMAAVKNSNYYEVVWVHPNVEDFNPPIFKNLNVTRLDCIDKDGMVDVPDGPGIGAEYDWEFINSNSTGKEEANL